jgi:hypothetical protein
MKGHGNNFFLPHSNHRSWGKNGERLKREKIMHSMRGSKDLYSRILRGIGKVWIETTVCLYLLYICHLLYTCQKPGMDRNYCLLVCIVYMSSSDT